MIQQYVRDTTYLLTVDLNEHFDMTYVKLSQ